MQLSAAHYGNGKTVLDSQAVGALPAPDKTEPATTTTDTKNEPDGLTF